MKEKTCKEVSPKPEVPKLRQWPRGMLMDYDDKKNLFAVETSIVVVSFRKEQHSKVNYIITHFFFLFRFISN